jgi:hypothetical protein
MPTVAMNAQVFGFLVLAGGTIFGQVLLALQQQPTNPSYHDIWSVLDRYGLPMAILSVIFWFGYKVFWPFMTSLIAANQELMKAELAHSRDQIKNQGDQFVAALAKRDELLRTEFQSLHDRLDDGFKSVLAQRQPK